MKSLRLWLILAATLATLRAATVASFGPADPVNPLAPDKTGATYTFDAATKAGRIGWGDTHRNFLEYYYAKGPELPTGSTPDGRLVLHISTDSPDALWIVGVRLKSARGEIFHFETKPQLTAGQWEDVSIIVRQGASKTNWGGDQSGRLEGPLRLVGYSLLVNPNAPAGGVRIDRVSWEDAGNEAGSATAKTDSASPIGQAGVASGAAAGVSPADLRYPLAEAHLFEPFWRAGDIHGESVVLKQDVEGGLITGTLYYEPTEVLRVRSSDGKTVYREGTDYTVDAARRLIVIPPGSRIPFLTAPEFYKQKGDPQAIAAKLGQPDVYLLYAERWFPTKQVEVDYRTKDSWDGYRPAFAGDVLPRSLAKLKAGKGLVIAVTGDSISAGANASKNIPPYQPAFPVLVQRALGEVYGGDIRLANVSVGGATANGGLMRISQVTVEKPDLVIIAYGMNDTAGKKPDVYRAKTEGMIEAVRAAVPDAEFLLVSSSLANPEWNWSPAAQFPAYAQALQSLAGPGVAFADATALWTELMTRKRYHDLTGNGINHPNDFGHRLYAQLILALLVDPARTAK